MKGRLLILRCTAALLILVFSQKTGAGLFYHNLFHGTEEMPANQEKGISLSCTCIDDFLAPFEETGQTELSIPVLDPLVITDLFEIHLPFHTPVYSSLRGPPAIING